MRIYFLNSFVFLSLIFLLVTKTSGQSWNSSYTHYDKLDGLPSNTVYYMTTDKNGILWLGTDAGLCRFDGSHFTIFTTEHGLPSNDVFELFCDSKNRIWMRTMSKEVCYYSKGYIHNKTNDSTLRKIKTKNNIVNYFEDKNKCLWIMSTPFVINKLSNDSLIIVDLSDNDNYYVNTVLRNEGIYFIASKHNYFYNYKTNFFDKDLALNSQISILGLKVINDTCYAINDNQKLIKNSIFALINGVYNSQEYYWTLYFASDKLWQLSNKGIKSYSLHNLNITKWYLENYSVSNLIIDKYKNIWISTLANGIFKLNSTSVINYKPHLTEMSNSMHSILVNDTYIFTGNNNGEISVIHKNKKKGIQKIYLNETTSASFRVLKFIVHKDILFICSDVNLYSYNLTSQKLVRLTSKNAAYKNIFLESDSLIALTNVGITYFDANNKIIKNYVSNERFYSHCTYNNKRLFGSENSLFYENNKLTIYPLDQPFKYRIMDLKVVDSFLIAAKTEKGIFFINKNKVIRNLNQANGLNSNNCSKIVPYQGDLYIATNNGICKYQYSSNTSYRIMESDGLASNNIQDLFISNDTLYAATDNGLTAIPLASLKTQKKISFFISPLIINKDTIYDKIKTIKTRTDHIISMDLNSISLGVKGKIKYYYRIKERDSSYKLTLDPDIQLKITDPGYFTLEAYSSDINDAVSEKASTLIWVKPYWWQTVLFKTICIAVMTIIIFLIYFQMILYVRDKEKKKQEVEDKMRRLELDAWKSNINPHFLFNSINTIQSLFGGLQFEKANHFIANFTKVLRKTVDHSDKLLNTIEEEIIYLENYLSLEKIKKSDNFTYVIGIDQDEIKKYYIPSLLLQPVIENSLKHGIHDITDGHIDVQLELTENQIIATITDNGVGLNKNYVKGVDSKGLRLISDKIRIVEKVTQTKINFEMKNIYSDNTNSTGTITKFTFPKYETNSYEFYDSNQTQKNQ